MTTDRTGYDRLVAQGLSDPQIAARYGVSARTVLRWRIRDGLASRWQPQLAAHGTPACGARGCDRPECIAAHRADATARRHAYLADMTRQTLPAARSHQPWTLADDDELLNGPGTILERALRLGRTYRACELRLQVLRRTRIG